MRSKTCYCRQFVRTYIANKHYSSSIGTNYKKLRSQKTVLPSSFTTFTRYFSSCVYTFKRKTVAVILFHSYAQCIFHADNSCSVVAQIRPMVTIKPLVIWPYRSYFIFGLQKPLFLPVCTPRQTRDYRQGG